MATQMCSIYQSPYTTDDYERIQFESQRIMTFITEFYNKLSDSENLGQQPEETLTINNSIDYNLCAILNIL